MGNNMDQPVAKITAKPKKAALHGDTGTTKEKPPVHTEQRNEIAPLLKKRLEKGDIWYLVDLRWFKQWKKYVGYDEWDQAQMGDDSAHPGPMDTSALFKDQNRDTLKDQLMEDLNYSLVPEEVWKKFVAWYGIEKSSQAIPRKVVEHGLYVKHCKVEVYLVKFKLALHPDEDKFLTKEFSRADTVGDLMKVMKETFFVPEEKECRVWHKYMLSTYDLLSKLDESIQDAGLYTNQLLLLEVKNEDGTWPRNTYTGTNMSIVRSTDLGAPSSSISSTDSKSKRSGSDVANQAASMSTTKTVAQSTLTTSATSATVSKRHKTTVHSVGMEKHSREQQKHKQKTEMSEIRTKPVKPKTDLVPVNNPTKFSHPPSGLKSAVSKPLEVIVPQEVTVTSSEDIGTQKTERIESKLEVETKHHPEFEKVSKRHKIESKSSQDLTTLQNRLHQKEREIETLSNKLSQNEKETVTITQNLATLSQQFQHNKEESEAKNQQVKAMNQALTVANQEIEKSLQVKENDLIAINEEILKLKDNQKLMEATYNQEIEVLRESLQSKDRDLRERLQSKEDEIAILRESFQQRETGSVQEIATLTERVQAQETQIHTQETQLQAQLQAQETQLQAQETQLQAQETQLQAQETQLQAQEVQQHTQVAQLQGQLQTQATQMQTFCNNALQQMRQQIEREMQRRMEQLTNQMTTMQTLFNAVKPQWLVSRNEVMLTQRNLGDGGYGRVVQATFRGEEVAAKRLHNQIISEYNIRRFVREMQVSSNCHHPNLLRFLGATLEGDHDPIILTELMETNLHDVIRRRELKDHQLNQVLQDIAGAVNYLHCLSPEPIIHRDISSSNVLLRGPVKFKWIAKLSDFGSANFLWHTTMQSAAPGNPTYAAPEVLNPHEHSEKMDVYSFGVLMFEMCSGQAPSLQVRNEVLPTAPAVWPDPQRHYVPLIVSCTRRNKDDRPSMSEVLAEL